jgi:hypothetical protein
MKFFVADPDQRSSAFLPWIRDGKIRIRDKHPRSATLQRTNIKAKRFLLGCRDMQMQGWAKLVLIALERYSVSLKRLTFNLS